MTLLSLFHHTLGICIKSSDNFPSYRPSDEIIDELLPEKVIQVLDSSKSHIHHIISMHESHHLEKRMISHDDIGNLTLRIVRDTRIQTESFDIIISNKEIERNFQLCLRDIRKTSEKKGIPMNFIRIFRKMNTMWNFFGRSGMRGNLLGRCDSL